MDEFSKMIKSMYGQQTPHQLSWLENHTGRPWAYLHSEPGSDIQETEKGQNGGRQQRHV